MFDLRILPQMSDRYGRARILSCAVVGVLLMDMNFLCVFWFYDYIPGGYWFLITGPVVEGLLGGEYTALLRSIARR